MALTKTILCWLILTQLATPSFAGGWPQPKGGYFLKLSEWWIASDQHFDMNGQVLNNTHEFGYYSTTLYAEYGLSNRFTGIIYFPFLNYTYSIPPSRVGKLSAWATGDAEVGLKYALLYNKQIAVSIQFLIGIPSGKKPGDIIGGLHTGDGEWNETIRLDAGSGFRIGSNDGWWNLYGGFNIRSDDFADELLYGFESGLKLSNNKLTFIARIGGIESVGEGSQPVNPQSLFSNKREYLSFAPEVIYHLSDAWGITAGVGTAFSGQNIFANPTFTLGIFTRR